MLVIDTHVRLVEANRADWRAEQQQMLRTHLDSGEICGAADCSFAAHRFGGVDSFVHVSNAKIRESCVAEAALVEQIARLHDLDLVMIAGIDPRRDGREILADLDEFAGSESFRGVRLPLGVPAHLGFVDSLLGWLAERELVVEISPLAEQVPGWVSALERYPEIVSVVGYDGWVVEPNLPVSQEWCQAFRTYADGNVDRWQVTIPHDGRRVDTTWESARPWLEAGVEILGWDRLMFATTLSLESAAGQYSEILAGLGSLMDGVDEDDRAKFWGENAAAAYRM